MSARFHPACDPVAHAGYLTCPICDAAGWPSEAEWLDDDRIVARFVPTCDHIEEQILVVGGGAA